MTRLLRALALSLTFACFARAPRPSHAQEASDLSGTWLMAQLTTTISRVPVVGKVYAQSRVISVHQLRHAGEQLHGPGTLCQLELESGSRLVRTALSKRALTRLPPPHLDARVVRGARGQLDFWQPRQLLIVGARLEKPLTDPLPTRLDAPQVIDEEGDGHPGLTIEVSGLAPGRLYVVQRSWTELKGSLVARDAFAGALRFDHEQVVLDATSFLLRRSLPSEPVLARSWFRLQRLVGETSCEAARARAKGWFE